MNSNDRARQLSVIVLSFVQILTNGVSSAGVWPSPYSINDIATSFPNLFVPADITFAVWTPLYLGALIYAVYQMLPAQQARPLHRRIGWWVASAAAANAAWTPLYVLAGPFGSDDFQVMWVVVSVVVMVWLLVSLIAVVAGLRNTLPNAEATAVDRWVTVPTFYGYLGWVSVATVANVTVLFISLGWEGTQTAALWSVVAIVAATVISAGVLLYSLGDSGTGGFLAVLVWALVGVYLGNSGQSMLVGVAALVAAAVLIGVGVFRFMNRASAAPQQAPSAA